MLPPIMKNLALRCVLLIAAFALSLPARTGQAAVIAWDSIPWVDGILDQSFDLNSDSINDFRVEVTGPATPGSPINAAGPYTGGFVGQKALQLWTTATGAGTGIPPNIQVTVTFLPGGLYDEGAKSLQYSVFDVDSGDHVVNASATLVAGGTAAPSSITGNPSFNSINSVFGIYNNDAMGTNPALDSSAEGTVDYAYGNDAIRSFTFLYHAHSDISNGIALGDLTFDISPVPEAGTVAACAIAGLLGAWGLRRMRREQPAV